jgi:hypothetical protein
LIMTEKKGEKGSAKEEASDIFDKYNIPGKKLNQEEIDEIVKSYREKRKK